MKFINILFLKINFDILKTQVSGSQGLLVDRNGGSKAEIKLGLEDAEFISEHRIICQRISSLCFTDLSDQWLKKKDANISS